MSSSHGNKVVKSNIAKLPDDVVEKVFTYLNKPSLENVLLVDKRYEY